MKKINKILFTLPSILLLFGCSKKSVYERKDDKVYFGSYPQTLETDSNKLAELNKKINNLPTETNLNGWSDYGYYINSEETSFMFYLDIDLDNDNNNDYRGVYFIEYRPNETALPARDTHSCQIVNGYNINTVYWFKYEPIKWSILEENDKTIRLISEIALDSHDYHYGMYSNQVEHNGGVGYSNNYELSGIRHWLNDDFYNSSFSSKEKNIIVEDTIDNSANQADTVENIYYCNDTVDNVTILSYKEVEKYFPTNADRLTTTTDYAKSQGIDTLVDNAPWQLRTPISLSAGSNLHVGLDGVIFFSHVFDTTVGVRPVIVIKK